MSIQASKLRDELKNPIGIQLSLDIEATKQLCVILNRALNTWPDAPAQWKELSDMLTHGAILQKYSDRPEDVAKINILPNPLVR